MKTGLLVIKDTPYYKRWIDPKTGEVFSQRKRLSEKVKQYLSERDLEVIKHLAKNKVHAIRYLKFDCGFTLTEALNYTKNLEAKCHIR